MTHEQIVHTILNMWQECYSDKMLEIGQSERQEQAHALARMAQREMDTLRRGGIDENTAWAEARSICLVPPVTPDDY